MQEARRLSVGAASKAVRQELENAWVEYGMIVEIDDIVDRDVPTCVVDVREFPAERCRVVDAAVKPERVQQFTSVGELEAMWEALKLLPNSVREVRRSVCMCAGDVRSEVFVTDVVISCIARKNNVRKVALLLRQSFSAEYSLGSRMWRRIVFENLTRALRSQSSRNWKFRLLRTFMICP